MHTEASGPAALRAWERNKFLASLSSSPSQPRPLIESEASDEESLPESASDIARARSLVAYLSKTNLVDISDGESDTVSDSDLPAPRHHDEVRSDSAAPLCLRASRAMLPTAQKRSCSGAVLDFLRPDSADADCSLPLSTSLKIVSKTNNRRFTEFEDIVELADLQTGNASVVTQVGGLAACGVDSGLHFDGTMTAPLPSTKPVDLHAQSLMAREFPPATSFDGAKTEALHTRPPFAGESRGTWTSRETEVLPDANCASEVSSVSSEEGSPDTAICGATMISEEGFAASFVDGEDGPGTASCRCSYFEERTQRSSSSTNEVECGDRHSASPKAIRRHSLQNHLSTPFAKLAVEACDSNSPSLASTFRLSESNSFEADGIHLRGGVGMLTNGEEISAMRLNEFERIRLLGQGASSKVYLMRYKPTGHHAAMKEVPATSDASLRHMALNELRMLSSARSEHLIRLFDAFFADGKISLCMEFADAGSLADILARSGVIPEAVMSAITLQLLHGLLYLHTEMRQVHRDLKPPNVMLTRAGRVKLADFGISRQLENSNVLALTQCGTAQYMSPERVRGESYSYSSDVWSCGVIILECMNGHCPFAGAKSFLEQASLICSKPLPPPPPESSSDAVHFLEVLCLRRDATQRHRVQALLHSTWIGTEADAIGKQDSSLEKSSRSIASWLELVWIWGSSGRADSLIRGDLHGHVGPSG